MTCSIGEFAALFISKGGHTIHSGVKSANQVEVEKDGKFYKFSHLEKGTLVYREVENETRQNP